MIEEKKFENNYVEQASPVSTKFDGDQISVLKKHFGRIFDYTMSFFQYTREEPEVARFFINRMQNTTKNISEIIVEFTNSYEGINATNHTDVISNLFQNLGDDYLQKSKLVPVVKLLCNSFNAPVVSDLQYVFDEITTNIKLGNLSNIVSEVCVLLSTSVQNDYDKNLCALAAIDELSQKGIDLLYDTALFNSYNTKINKCLNNKCYIYKIGDTRYCQMVSTEDEKETIVVDNSNNSDSLAGDNADTTIYIDL